MPSVSVPAEYLGVLERFAVDAVALTLLLGLLALRRRGGRDLLLACAAFNVGLFAVVQVISGADIGVGAGFGLFAVLSIIRLRSELFTNTQLGYVFIVLALALVTGLPGVATPMAALLAALMVGTVAVLDAGRGARPVCTVVTLDTVAADPVTAAAQVERLLGLQVTSVQVVDVDLVRETTRLEVRHLPLPANQVQARTSQRVEQL